jgi:hypothetical protein
MRSALAELEGHTAVFLESVGIDRRRFESQGLGLQPLHLPASCDETSRLALARRYQRSVIVAGVLFGSSLITHRWGEWIQELSPGWPMVRIPIFQTKFQDPASPVLKYLSLATKLDDTW